MIPLATLANPPGTRTAATSDVNRMVAMILGGILLLVGLLGFVNDPVLGIFETSLMHNLIHVITGAILLAAAFMNNGRNARTVNLVLGVIYLLVTLVGFVAPGVLEAMGVQVNPADHFLHLLLGIVLTGVAFVNRAESRRPMTGTRI